MTNLYCLGIGPGNSDYLTLEAAKILSEAQVVFCPQSEAKKSSLALSICQKHINDDAEIVNLTFPMTKDNRLLKSFWQKATDIIIEKTKSLQTAAFVTLGDPSIYSTYAYIIEKLKNEPALEVKTVPGITAFSASASALNMALVEGDEKLALLPLTDLKEVEQALDNFETVVLYKVKGNLSKIYELLMDRDLLDKSYLISKASSSDEKITKLSDGAAKKNGYFSTLIIKKGEE